MNGSKPERKVFSMQQTPVTQAQLNAWSEAYQSDPSRQLATLALSKTPLNDVMYVTRGANAMRMKFSITLESLDVTDQQSSGRCWLFAATNVLRERIAKRLNLENFELSQSYLAFWDKFERCNYFFESILQTADQPVDSREVQFILQTGIHDGGQWDMFANIVAKYGVVPKDVYDDTYQASHTRDMNHLLNRSTKAGAAKLRRMVKDGASAEEIKAEKDAMLGKLYGFLCSCYGEPPRKFDFEYVTKDKAYFLEQDMTPQSFCQKYVGDLLDQIVSIINAPTADKPYGKVYTIKLLGNVVGGRQVRHLNLTMDEFKAAIIAQLKAGKVVWFGSDVGKWGDRPNGIWDDGCFNAELLSGLDVTLTKADSLDYSFAAMNHAMVITGVNLVDGKPNRWKIENSWGEKSGRKGYYVCSDSWFDQYVFQAAVEKEYLGDAVSLIDQEAIELAPWDPMGTLAD